MTSFSSVELLVFDHMLVETDMIINKSSRERGWIYIYYHNIYTKGIPDNFYAN